MTIRFSASWKHLFGRKLHFQQGPIAGRLALLEGLVESFVISSVLMANGDKPIHSAAKHGQVDDVKTFLSQGTCVDERNDSGQTPLHYAAREGQLEVLTFLIEKMANIDGQDARGRTALHYAIKNRRTGTDIAENLINLGANLDVQDGRGKTALHLAIKNGYTVITENLIKLGANIDVQDREGKTALHSAVEKGFTVTAQDLIKLGANPNVLDWEGKTALHLAIENGYTVLAENLIKLGVNLDIRDEDGKRPLHFAIKNGYIGTAIELITRGANLDVELDSDGKTALHYALETKTGMKLLHYVLQYQNDLNIIDIHDNTALSYLIKKVMQQKISIETVDLFIESGAYLSTIDCQRMMKSPSLQKHVMKNVKLCARVIVNKFNYQDLPELYELHVRGNLPSIENMKIQQNSGAMREIERTVDQEIKTEGYYNFLRKPPILLSLLSVDAYISSERSRRKLSGNLRRRRNDCCSECRGFLDPPEPSGSQKRPPPSDPRNAGSSPSKVSRSEAQK